METAALKIGDVEKYLKSLDTRTCSVKAMFEYKMKWERISCICLNVCINHSRLIPDFRLCGLAAELSGSGCSSAWGSAQVVCSASGRAGVLVTAAAMAEGHPSALDCGGAWLA